MNLIGPCTLGILLLKQYLCLTHSLVVQTFFPENTTTVSCLHEAMLSCKQQFFHCYKSQNNKWQRKYLPEINNPVCHGWETTANKGTYPQAVQCAMAEQTWL